MIALVTGGAGFIGSHLVDRLLADGHEVRVLDDFSTGHEENLADHPGLTVTRGTIADYGTVASLMTNVNWVFHEAAVASVQKTVEDPLGTQKVNYQGTLNILEAARENRVKRVVFAASAAAYGDDPQLPKREELLPTPLSPYAVDKLASEHACQVYAKLYGVETVCLRYFNVYGPRQDPSSPYSGVISIFVDRVSQGIEPVIFGDGGQTRDFVYVADVVEANLKAATTPQPPPHSINIATENPTDLKTLLKTICRIKGVEFKPAYQPERPGDIRHSYAMITAARKYLGWAPEVELEDGLRRLIASLV
jgi:UDP-glucose 4-epimerase